MARARCGGSTRGRVRRLTFADGGRWAVLTTHSRYELDLDACTAERFPGPDSTHRDFRPGLQWLRSIENVAVGQCAYLTFHARGDFLMDYYWALTTPICSIRRLPS